MTASPPGASRGAPNADLPPVYTIGHSTRTIAEFVDLLRTVEVSMVVDVRSIPRSRTNPQYNLDRLPDELSEWQIRHAYIPELGGRRKVSREIPPEVNAFWKNRSFHNYADHALSAEFRRGFDQLVRLSREGRVAIMCAEALWWRCHRRIVADYLLCEGREVLHVMERGAEAAPLTPAARVKARGIEYPAEDGGTPRLR